MRDELQPNADPVRKTVADRDHGFLLEERLRPDEVSRIEDLLRSAVRERGSHRRRSLTIAAAAAGVLLALVAWGISRESASQFGPRTSEANPLASRAANRVTRTMRLEIVRSDLPDARPSRIFIELEIEPTTN